RTFPFDLFPRVIPAEEWALIEAGLVQRVRAAQLVPARRLARGEDPRRRRDPAAARAVRRTPPPPRALNPSARSAGSCRPRGLPPRRLPPPAAPSLPAAAAPRSGVPPADRSS